MEFTRIDGCRFAEWDQFVSGQASGHFMQSLAWGRFKKASGWEVEHFSAMEDGRMRGAGLVLSRQLPVVRKKLYYMPRGPVAENADPSILLFLLKHVAQHIRSNNGLFMRVDPYVLETDDCDSVFESAGYRKLTKKWSYWNCPKFVFWLDLREGIDAVYGKIRRKKRWEIRSAQKKGIKIVEGGLEDLRDFYNLMLRTASRKNIGVHDFEYYESIMGTLKGGTSCQLFLAKHNDETAAAGISIAYGRNAWLFYFASSEQHFHLNPNRALQWEMIKWAAERGCTRYDFRGTATDDPPNPSDPGYGVYKFKKSFNPVFTRTAGYYDFVASGLLYRAFRIAEEHLLPLAVNGMNRMTQLRDAMKK